jgi:hypothetical protein
MVVEIKGQQLRIRVLNPKRFGKFRTQDVGVKGRLMRIAAFSKRTGWKTQAYRLNLKDYRGVRDVTRQIRKLRISKSKKKRAIQLAKKFFMKKLMFTSRNNGHRHKWRRDRKFTSRNNGHKHRISLRLGLALMADKHSHRLLKKGNPKGISVFVRKRRRR